MNDGREYALQRVGLAGGFGSNGLIRATILRPARASERVVRPIANQTSFHVVALGEVSLQTLRARQTVDVHAIFGRAISAERIVVFECYADRIHDLVAAVTRLMIGRRVTLQILVACSL